MLLQDVLDMLHDNPLDSTNRLVCADWCDENGHEWMAGPLRAGRIPLCHQDLIAIEQLKLCNHLPATWDKRFARNLAPVDNSLTARQYLFLWINLRKYRRSVSDVLIRKEAEKRHARYMALHEAGMVKPTYKPVAENNPTQEHFRKRRRTLKTNLQVKMAEMPLFD